MNGIEAKNLRFSFEEEILKGLTFSFPEKGLIGILGSSGAGKSTLLNVIAGLQNNYQGSLKVMGVSFTGKSEEYLREFRLLHISYIKQDYALLEDERPLENTVLPLLEKAAHPRKLLFRKGLDALSSLGISSRLKERVGHWSGGERQRCCIARALASGAEIILADEPTGALDESNAKKVFSLLRKASKKALVIVVSHDEVLLRKHSDFLYHLKDGKFIKAETILNPPPDNLPTLSLTKRKEPVSLGLFFWLKHAAHWWGKGKGRFFFLCFILSFSLSCLSLSIYCKTTLSQEFSTAFSQLLGEPTVVVQKKNPDSPTFGKIIAAGEGSVSSLCSESDDLLEGYGVSYLCDFESFFPDENIAYVPFEGKKNVIPSLDIRTAAEFQWLEKYSGDILPEEPQLMEDDQIILGLPYSSMFNLCFALHILRSYAALGEYISTNHLDLVFSLVNESWSYEDEQILQVVGITASKVPTIIHQNRRWSTYLLEFKMRFPTSDVPDATYPWIMQKIFFVVPRKDGNFREAIRGRTSFEPYIFEKESYDLNHSVCSLGSLCGSNRYHVFLCDKMVIDRSSIESISSIDGVAAFSVCGDGGYTSYPSSMMAGFSLPFMVTSKEENVTTFIDAYGHVKKSDSRAEPVVGECSIVGSLWRPASSNLSFSSNFASLVSGRKPASIDEIVLSTHLYEKLRQPEEIFVAGEIGEKEVGEYLIRDIRSSSLRVVGLVSSSFDTLFGDSYWVGDFLTLRLGQTAFLEEPTKIIVYPEDGVSASSLRERIRNKISTFDTLDPFAPLKASSQVVISTLDLILTILTSISIVFSGLLLLGVFMLLDYERIREKAALRVAGLSKNEEILSSLSILLFILGFSYSISLVSSIGIEGLLSLKLAEFLGVSPAFSFSLSSLLFPLLPLSLALFSFYTRERSSFKKKREG